MICLLLAIFLSGVYIASDKRNPELELVIDLLKAGIFLELAIVMYFYVSAS